MNLRDNMQKNNILILWLGAFGYAVACYLGRNNPEMNFYAAEKNPEIFQKIQETRKHPYFFKDIQLPDNIELVENADMYPLLQKIDIIISVIPCQFVASAFSEMKDYLTSWVIIVNLAKGINNQTFKTSSETLAEIFWDKKYSYAYLAGGMIAEELVAWNQLGADIVTEDTEAWNILKELFHSDTLDINLKIWNPKNTELAAALKNIVALILGYYEWQWAWASTLGYYFAKLTCEMNKLIELLGNSEKVDFSDYAFSGDLIATCFWNSRNRLLGNMLGKWMSIEEALAELKAQKKIAEGYETLKWIKSLIEWNEGFEEIQKFCEKYI
jgi:glycerol-3-phosphate dehydrogenase (NAD(P)+)